MQISDLAEAVGVATSTVRYYERVGLMAPPPRTRAGYRAYGDDDAARLLFVVRARKMGLSCDQIAELLPIWDGTNCAEAQARVSQLIDEKQAEIAGRIAELERFTTQLDQVRAAMSSSPPRACRTDLTCCVPDAGTRPLTVDLSPSRAGSRRR